MVSENDVRVRLHDTEAQLQALSGQIPPLQQQVSSGTEEWAEALEMLAACYQQLRDLEVQRESLAWVLARDEQYRQTDREN